MNPMHMLAVRGLASLDVPKTKSEKQKLRTALITVLSAAGVDADGIGKKATVSIDEYAEHVLLVWYDLASDALRVFAPSESAIDETTESALELLNGHVHADFRPLPIEDIDAIVRVLALMSGAADDAAELYARMIAPNLGAYDHEFVAPELAELEAMWGTWFRYYVGGSTAALGEITPWIKRVYAFGTGPLPEAPKQRPAPTKTKTKKKN